MTFLADESVDHRLVLALRSKGLAVGSVTESASGSSDRQVLEMAVLQDSVLITEDKDFGELTFRLHLPNRGIMLVRSSDLSIEERADAMIAIAGLHATELGESFVVLGNSGAYRVKRLSKRD
jgi:predicted nuclease of predicted toxin-antitoxin system